MRSAQRSAASVLRRRSSVAHAPPGSRHAGRRLGDQHDRHAGAVARRHQEGVGGDALEHEALLAVEPERVAAPGERGLEGGRLERRRPLRDRERHQALAARDRRQPRAALRVGAERVERQTTRDGREHPERRDCPPALLDQQPEVAERGPLPARGLRQREAEPTELGHRAPERRVVPLRGAIPLEPPRACDLRGEEPPRLLLDRLLLVGGGEVHELTSAADPAHAER
jgi:hypothetical protein